MDRRERRPRRATALVAGWLGVGVGMAGVAVAGATSAMLAIGRAIELDYAVAGIVGGLGAVYLVGGLLLLRRRMLGRRMLVTMSGVMSGATLLVVVLNGWGFGPMVLWLGLNVVLLLLSVIEATRRWTTTR